MGWRAHPHSDEAFTPESVYASRGGASARWNVRRWACDAAGETSTLLWLIPLAIAVAYLAVFVVQLPHNIREVAWGSDYASGFTMPETLVRTGTSGNTVISSSGQWVSLWFGLLTARLPLHRQLWGAAPTLLFVTTALTVAWSVAQVANRRAAILAALLGLVASPLALAFFMAAVAHNTLYPCTALVGAYLIWLTRGAGRRWTFAFTVPPLMGIVVGACLASDLLVVVTAVVPLAIAAIAAGVQRERRARLLALSALSTIAVAIPTAVLTTSIMHSLGYLTLPTPETVVPVSELPERATLLFKGLKALFNGYLGGSTAPGTLHEELGVASAIVMSAALLALPAFGVYTAVLFIYSGVRKPVASDPLRQARALHVIYWVTSAAAAGGAFWIAGETGGGTNLHESYYATIIFSVAAVIPLLLSSGIVARALIAVGSSIFFTAGLVGLTGGYMSIASAVANVAPNVERAAKASHVTVGYGGYGLGSSLTWNTDGRVIVRPLLECANPNGANICPFYMSSVPSWYVPQARHTFLLVDSEEPWVSRLPSGLGAPLTTYRFGPVVMYVYPYDIASRLGPQQD
jgi:hypothetical protein